MKYIIFLLFVGLNFATAQTAEEIVDKHFEMTGGAENWNAMNSIYLEGQVTIGLGQSQKIKVYHRRPYFKNVSFVIDGKEVLSEGYDGTNGYTYDNQNQQNMRIPSYKPDAFENDILNYDKKGFTIKYLGKEKVNGTETFKIQLKKNTQLVNFWFSTENYELLKEESDIETIYYNNFTKIDGLSFAKRLEITPKGGEEYILEFTKIVPNAAMDDSKFIFEK